MKGDAKKLLQFMEGSSKRFMIPVYQRNYDWKLDNCKQLFKDLENVKKQARKSHFFGSIVSYFNPDGDDDEYQIIDGQQRLTTVSLLMLALYNLLNEGKLVAEKGYLADQLYENYLIDKWNRTDKRLKLKPVKNDVDAYEKLFKDKEHFEQDSNLTFNYNYFYNRLQNTFMTPDDVYDSLKKLEIIDITLNGDDNPQLIFESLNSTGLALSEGDKIRNYVLMGQPVLKQEALYEKWHRIEKNTQYDVSAFIRDWLSLKTTYIPAMSKVYQIFKEYVEPNALSIEPLLEELKEYSEAYRLLLSPKDLTPKSIGAIKRLNMLGTTVIRPFMLSVLSLYRSGVLKSVDVENVISTIESYIFRRMICDQPTNCLSKIFATASRDIYSFEENWNDFVDKFRYILNSKKQSGYFPTDAEFIEAFTTKQVYKMNSKNRVYILERFENDDIAEDKDIYSHIDDCTYSIEHVMPQHLTEEWQEALGENYDDIHQTWLHRIANLTLTAYNSKYSNKSFEEKKNMPKGFKESGLRLNTYFYNVDNWDAEALEDRNDFLMARAEKIWPKEESNFVPVKSLSDVHTLEDTDDADLSGTSIEAFSFKDNKYEVSSWKEFMIKVVSLIYEEDPTVINAVISTEEGLYPELAPYFTKFEGALRNAYKMDYGFYMETNTSTYMKLSILRKLFAAYEMDQSDLVMYIDDSNVADENATINKEYRYFSLLLPELKDVFSDTGLWKHTKPQKWDNRAASIHVPGCGLIVKIQHDTASTFLYIDKKDKKLNKQIFDELYSHKDEIEASCGYGDCWSWLRNDDKRHSKIMIKMNISTNEDNWSNVTAFHKDASRKLYDAVMPYMKKYM